MTAPQRLPRGLDFKVTEQQREELWAMTRDERVEAMYQGQLTAGQLTLWSRVREREVPLMGGELAYLVMQDPDWCEPSESKEQA